MYAPYGLVHDPARAGLRRSVVRTRVGPVVVHAGERRTDGPATVLLHGAAGSWTTWTPLLQAAAAENRVPQNLVLLDLPGFGASDLPDRPLSNGRSSVSVAAYAGVVRDAAEALGHRSWNLVGHSMGAFIALHLAATDPVHTRSVTLVSPTGPAVVEAARHPLRGLVRMPAFALLRAVMEVLSPTVARVSLAGLRKAGLLTPVVAPLFAHARELSSDVSAALGAEVRPEAFSAAARAAAEYDLAQWSAISQPIRSVRGRRDVFVGRSDDAALARLVPGLTTTVLEDAGHFAQIEAPFAVLDLICGTVPAWSSR